MTNYCRCGHPVTDHEREYGCNDTDCYCTGIKPRSRPGTKNPRPRGICSVCATVVSIRKNGTLVGHGAGSYYSLWCQGSSVPPMPVDA